MNNQLNGEKISKYESLSIKEQMQGIKSSQALPEDFYEKILECELSLKEKFDMQILSTLIQYYSLAVEHFGSIGDAKKCEEYNENLNLLFKQMEVRKYMKEGKDIELNAKKEKLKNEMKKAENLIDSNVAKKIIKGKERTSIKSGKSIIVKEIFSQALNFKQKLENKKKKYKLKLNFENLNTSMISKTQKSNTNIPLIHKKSKSTKNKRNKNSFSETTIDDTLNNSFKSEKNKKTNLMKIKSKSFLNSNDFSSDKIIGSKEETDDFLSCIEINLCDESNDIKLNLTSRSSKILPSLDKNDDITKLTGKKTFQKKIKSIISDYMQEYYNLYMKNNLNKIIKEYEKYSNSLSEELIYEEINYYNQEKQMEYLRDEDESYRDQIEGAIENIKTEKEKKINDIYEKYHKNIGTINNKYLQNPNNNFSSNDIEIMKEKMKLELIKEINSSVLK
jgi:hypothetical protein